MPEMRASRVPLKAGAWVPTPSAPITPPAPAGMPDERSTRCSERAASTVLLAAVSCWAGVCLVAVSLPPLHPVSARPRVRAATRARACRRMRLTLPVPPVQDRGPGPDARVPARTSRAATRHTTCSCGSAQGEAVLLPVAVDDHRVAVAHLAGE